MTGPAISIAKRARRSEALMSQTSLTKAPLAEIRLEEQSNATPSVDGSLINSDRFIDMFMRRIAGLAGGPHLDHALHHWVAQGSHLRAGISEPISARAGPERIDFRGPDLPFGIVAEAGRCPLLGLLYQALLEGERAKVRA
jgi:hypothetical protein